MPPPPQWLHGCFAFASLERKNEGKRFFFLGAHFAVVLSGLPLSPLSEVKE